MSPCIRPIHVHILTCSIPSCVPHPAPGDLVVTLDDALLLCQFARSARISLVFTHSQQLVDLPGRVATCKHYVRLIADDTRPAPGNRTLMRMTDGKIRLI
jgi:hypothetical protein